MGIFFLLCCSVVVVVFGVVFYEEHVGTNADCGSD